MLAPMMSPRSFIDVPKEPWPPSDASWTSRPVATGGAAGAATAAGAAATSTAVAAVSVKDRSRIR
jgi:hypothetical protein